MTDLDAEIRRAVCELADHAPVPPGVDDLAITGTEPWSACHAGLRSGGRRPLLVMAVTVGIVLIGAGAIVASRREDSTVVQLGLAPGGATVADVAGQTLAARVGFASPPSGYDMPYEFGRDGALTTADSPLPTGPLGPVYAQYLQPTQPAEAQDPTTGDTLPDPALAAVGVMTVLPIERTDVVMGAAGHTDGQATTVNGHPALVVTAWSEHDDNLVSWEQDGVAVVVVGSATTPVDELRHLAGQVAPLSQAPMLAPAQPDSLRSVTFNGFWSLAPDAPMVPRPGLMGIGFTGWSTLRGAGPLWNAFSTVVDHGSVDQGRYTVRAAGHPEGSANLAPAAPGRTISGQVQWDDEVITDQVIFSSGNGPDLIEGITPTTVKHVRIRLSDGSTYLALTYDVGRGWPIAIFVQPVPIIHGDNTPTGLHAVHIDGLSADGAVLNSGPSTLGNGVPSGMAGYESVFSCHPKDPTRYVFTDDCAKAGG